MRHPRLTVAVMRGLVTMADAAVEQLGAMPPKERSALSREEQRKLADVARAVRWTVAKAAAVDEDQERRKARLRRDDYSD